LDGNSALEPKEWNRLVLSPPRLPQLSRVIQRFLGMPLTLQRQSAPAIHFCGPRVRAAPSQIASRIRRESHLGFPGGEASGGFSRVHPKYPSQIKDNDLWAGFLPLAWCRYVVPIHRSLSRDPVPPWRNLSQTRASWSFSVCESDPEGLREMWPSGQARARGAEMPGKGGAHASG